MSVVQDVGKALIPPHDANPERLFWWRLTLAGVTFMNFAGLTLHVALACGYVSFFGFQGFAQAEDMRAQGVQITAMRADAIDEQVVQFREKQCDALTAHNDLAARQYGERIRERQRQYQELTHQQVAIPSCDEI